MALKNRKREAILEDQTLTSRDISSTFVKGLSVLKSFDDSRTRLTLAEIAKHSSLDRATARRLTLTLVHLGYVKKEDRHFSLTPKVLVLAGSFLRGNHVGSHVQPVLNHCSDALNSSVSLAILDEDAAVYVAQSISVSEKISHGFTIGSRLPLLHTAIGRMILAYSDQGWAAKEISEAGFEQYTSATVEDRTEIGKRVGICRANGHAIVSGEFEANITAFAVPVGTLDDLKAVIGTTLPTSSASKEEARDRVIFQLQDAANTLTRSQIF